MAGSPPFSSHDPEATFTLFAALAGQLEREQVQVAHFDRAGGLLALSEPCAGVSDAVPLPIREIMGEALRLRSAGLIVAHNHPSGDPSPSRRDIAATRQLAEVARGLGIRLLDHLVISGARWTSFRALGLL